MPRWFEARIWPGFSSAEGGFVQQVGLVSRFFDNAGNYSLRIQGDGQSIELPSTNPKPILEACERHALLAQLLFGNGFLDLVDHQLHRHDMPDADMMMRALGQDLVLDLDRREACGFRHLHRVTDVHRIAEAGGGIGLVTEDDRVRFDINHATLTRDNLRASSQLLRLGRNVFGLKGF